MNDEMYIIKARTLGNVRIEHLVYLIDGESSDAIEIRAENAFFSISFVDGKVAIDDTLPYWLGDCGESDVADYGAAFLILGRLLTENDPLNAFMKY